MVYQLGSVGTGYRLLCGHYDYLHTCTFVIMEYKPSPPGVTRVTQGKARRKYPRPSVYQQYHFRANGELW